MKDGDLGAKQRIIADRNVGIIRTSSFAIGGWPVQGPFLLEWKHRCTTPI